MKIKILVVAVSTALTSMITFAQNTQPAIIEDFKPSIFNQPFQQYPQVNSQGYARFRILAPNADSVRVSLGLGGQGGTKLVKADSGYFIGTTAGPMDNVGSLMIKTGESFSPLKYRSVKFCGIMMATPISCLSTAVRTAASSE